MVVFESEFSIFDWDEANSIFTHTFKPGSKGLTDEKFREEMAIYVESFQKYHPKRAIVDNRDLGFTISPELQEWHSKSVFPPCIEAGVERAALILTSDLFAQVAVEQLMEEEETGAFQTQYFDDLENAKAWLMEV